MATSNENVEDILREMRECLRVSTNAMEMVVQWLGEYPAWQEGFKGQIAENRNALEGAKYGND